MNMYIDYYNDTITEQFAYQITTETDGSKTLVIINNNSDIIVNTNTFFNSAPQELTGNNWYLHNLIIDGNDNIPPNNTELSEILLNFTDSEGDLATYACDFLIASHFFDYALSKFYLYETSVGLFACGIPTNNDFHNLYIDGFYLNGLPRPFSYEYIINDSNETLTITNALGNQAVYGNFTLSTQEFTNSLFLIYPNPVKEFLNIEVSNNEKILQVCVYNLLGKKF